MNNKYTLALAASIVVAALILALPIKSYVASKQTLTVTGSSKMKITSNFASLKLRLYARDNLSGKNAYSTLLSHKVILEKAIKKYGDSLDIVLTTPYYFEQIIYNNQGFSTGKIDFYEYSVLYTISSTDVNLIAKMGDEAPLLMNDGINVRTEGLEFYYTKIQDLKMKIQAEAAKDAKARAEKIAEACDAKLGNIISARMGVIQIVPHNSNIIDDYGINDVSSIEKDITAVVTSSYILE